MRAIDSRGHASANAQRAQNDSIRLGQQAIAVADEVTHLDRCHLLHQIAKGSLAQILGQLGQSISQSRHIQFDLGVDFLA